MASAITNPPPSIDVLQSFSRTMPDATTADYRLKAGQVPTGCPIIRDTEDLVTMGAYARAGANTLDAALDRRETLAAFLCQPADTSCKSADALSAISAL